MHMSMTTKKRMDRRVKITIEATKKTFSTLANMFFIVLQETTQPLQLNVNFAIQH